MEPVTVELNESEVLEKSDSEKLDAIVKIAFATHKQVVDQRLILFGNGDPKKGLVYKVTFQGSVLKWALSGISGVTVLGLIAKYFLG